VKNIPNFKKIKFIEALDHNIDRKIEVGLRVSGHIKKSLEGNPLITIITVVRNKSDVIEETIQSVLNQKYKNIEYIIIDGESDDGTTEKIMKYKDQIDYFVCESDLGLYDAMNKGLSLAKGDLIGIVNGDDILLPNATNILVQYFIKYKDADFFFGSVKKHWGTISGFYPHKIKYSWFFYTSHSTGFFIKRNVAYKNGAYSLNYKYSSDFDYFYRLIVHNRAKGIATKKSEVFGIFRPGGLSHTLDKEIHFFEKIQIRIDNKQNKIFLFFFIILKFLINQKSKNRIKIRKFMNFILKNFF